MTAGVGVLSEFHDSLQDAIYIFDEDGVLVDGNDRVGEVSGQTVDAMLGTTLEELLEEWGTGSAVADGMDAYHRVADGDADAARVEFSLRNSRGQPVPVDARFTRYEEYVVGILRNLAEIRERESELQSLSDQLAILNRVLRHDIRNDMNVVTGWLEELREHVPPEGETALANVEEAVSHTIELTREAHDLAEVVIDGGDMPVQPVGLASVLSLQAEQVQRHHPDATIEIRGDLPDVDVAANEMLSSVFDNVLGNAVLHNDTAEPHVTIDVDVDEAAGTVTVRVADDGLGIPESMQDSLFGRGEKGIDSPGTGMGLYLVNELVTGYGGDVHVEPNDPRGSVFVVTLELAERD